MTTILILNAAASLAAAIGLGAHAVRRAQQRSSEVAVVPVTHTRAR